MKSTIARSFYFPIKAEDTTEDHELELESRSLDLLQQRKSRFSTLKRLLIASILVTIFLAFIVGGTSIRNRYESRTNSSKQPTSQIPNDSNLTNSSSTICPKRQEWRSLSPSQQQSYIAAVKCLLDQPSSLQSVLSTPNISAYSDFPYTHAHVGYRTHNSAPFLPWHRYLLHIYDSTLKTKCNYTGGLVYWDWTLDSDDLASSPIFDPITGFGGDGSPDGQITVGKHGRCIVDGPFAGVQALWYDVKYQPHCLSRGFRNDNGAGKMNGKDVSKSSIDKVLSLETYDQFVREMEVRVHDAIPFGIGGDFETFSAPFDPLFYLHHVQLDRLWWLWQHQDSPDRLKAYAGRNGKHSIEQAKLSDMINMGPFATSIPVEAVMDTSGDHNMLCYSY